MGTVWSGADEMLHRPVAVKELQLAPDLPEDEAAELRERALREARAMAMVTHPNVVMLYDVAWESGTPFVVMELVTGQSLAKVLDRGGPLDQRQLALVVDGVAGALQAAHRIGIVHRDVKPGNVLAGKHGVVKLGDFGLARNGADPSLTKTGFLMGTPAFLAPEAATGERVDSSADLWSLGALLFHAAEGRLAYGSDDPMAVIGSIVYGEVPRHHQTGPIGELISGLMVKDPVGRMPLEEVQRTVRPLLPESGANSFEDLLNPDAPAMNSGAIPLTQPIPRGDAAIEHDDRDGGVAADAAAPASPDLRDDERVVGQQHSSPDSESRVIAGRYVLETCLGRGATGTVWTGTDTEWQRPVMVKELRIPENIPADQAAEMSARAVRETRVMASVTHPNVAQLYDVAWLDDKPFVVMELVLGQSLADVLERNGAPLDEQQLALVADGVAGALQAARQIGIVHRDVQPDNVLVGIHGEIKLGDFGIVRNGADPTFTEAGHVLGSPTFIAPEVAAGRRVSSSADSWSLGAMLFRAAEGRPAYGGSNPLRVIGSILYGSVPGHHQTGVIGELISGLMVKAPASRMSLEQVQRSVRPLLPEAGANPFEGLLDPDAPAVRGNADSTTRPIPRGRGRSDG